MMQPGRERDGETAADGAAPLRRGWLAGVRRQPVLVAAIFSILASLLFLAGPRMKRSYRVTGAFTVRAPEFAALPELAQLPASTVKGGAMQVHGAAVSVTLGDLHADKARTITLSSAGNRRDLAAARVQAAAQQIGESLENRAQAVVNDYRARLEKSADDAGKHAAEASVKVDSFGLAHRGVLPGDPESIMGQFEALTTKLNGKQQDLLTISQQIDQLQNYKKTNEASGGRGVAPPVLTGDAGTPSAAAVAPAMDPEVVALTAQLQLLDHQLNEQLTVMGRTEQHPYVVDLRKQQTAMRSKLEAAKQRAAAGKPAPTDVGLPQAVDSSPNANLQAADQKLLQLQAQHEVLDTEVKQLTQQHDALQKKVDDILPQRQAYEKLTAALASAQSDAAAVRAQRAELDRRFPEHAPGSVNPDAGNVVEISALTLNASSTLPDFPQLPWVYAVGLILAALAAATVAVALRARDKTVHTPREFATLVDLPMLGSVSEIRTPREERARRMWRIAGRPLVFATLVLLLVGSAVLAYREMADPSFGAGTPPSSGVWLLSAPFLTQGHPPTLIFTSKTEGCQPPVRGSLPWQPSAAAFPFSNSMGNTIE